MKTSGITDKPEAEARVSADDLVKSKMMNKILITEGSVWKNIPSVQQEQERGEINKTRPRRAWKKTSWLTEKSMRWKLSGMRVWTRT